MLSVTRETFNSRSRQIEVELFCSKKTPQPAIILLYGAGGVKIRHEWYQQLAKLVAKAGFAAFLVHYFDRTGTGIADRETAQKCFLQWIETITDAASFVAEHPRVVRGKIGLLGISLGASLALFVAGRVSTVGALALFFAEIPENSGRFIKSLPPTFIVHGRVDRMIPVVQAYKLAWWLRNRGVPVELKIYPRQGHIFPTITVDNATESAIIFFRKFLSLPDTDLNHGGERGGDQKAKLGANV